MYISGDSTVYINASYISFCTAKNGGGIFVDYPEGAMSLVVLTSSKMFGNSATEQGGAIHAINNFGAVDIKAIDTVFENNTALRPDKWGGGGGIFLTWSTNFIAIRTKFKNNVAINNQGHQIMTYTSQLYIPKVILINTEVISLKIGDAFYGFDGTAHDAALYGGTENCSTAPTQCQDNGYSDAYVRADKPNQNEGVLCKPPCNIPTSGRFTISQDCIQATQIVVADSLEVVGIPSTDGRLPKVHGGGSNRFLLEPLRCQGFSSKCASPHSVLS